MGEDPDNRRAQTGGGDVPRLTAAAAPAENRAFKYQALFHNAADIVALFAPDGVLVEINQQFEDELGAARAEVIGQNVTSTQILTPSSSEQVLHHLSQILAGQPRALFEIEAVRPDGAVVPYEVNAVPILSSGSVKLIQANLRNISARRQEAEALRNNEETIRVLLNAAPTAAFMIDTQGIVLAVNHIAAMRLGLPAEAIVGRPISEFSPPPVAELRRQKGIEAIRTGQPLFFEDTCEGRTFSTSVHPVCNEQGQVIQLAVHSRDITEEKKSEDERRTLTIQLQQAQKMEAIGTLAGGIAHDFNNLLMAIQGNVSLMLFDAEPSHPHHRTLTNIEKLIRSGADLTSKLLGYARKGKYESRTLLLNDLLQETAETFGRMRKDIRIEWDLAPDLKGIVADKGQVEQVLLNLFVNASDAMPGGGKLFLKTDTVTHREIPRKGYTVHPGPYVRLTVTDTGLGIDKEIIDRIFDPFFTTKKMGRGTGLGLASAYGIVKSHNGYIDVESEKGQGSTFFIYFPATDARPTAAAEKIGKPEEGFGTLLLVDDEAAVLDVTAAMLRRLGYTVFTARSGREAIASYTEHADRISAVVLDMIMPEMGGGEVFDQLKRINPRVKVLLASGYSMQGQAREIMNRGCNGFLQKPFTLEDISVRLRSLIGRR